MCCEIQFIKYVTSARNFKINQSNTTEKKADKIKLFAIYL